MRTDSRSTDGLRSIRIDEDAVTLQVDDLLGLGDRERDRVVAGRMGVGANEPVLLHAVGSVLLDGAGGLVVAVAPERRRPDAEALVLDGRNRRPLDVAGCSPAGQPAPRRLEFRE